VKKVRLGVFAIIREVHRAADEVEARGLAAARATTNTVVSTGESAVNVAQNTVHSGTEVFESVQRRVSRSFISSAFSLDTLNPFRGFSADFSNVQQPTSDREEEEGLVEVSHFPSDANEQEPEAGPTEYHDARPMTDNEILRIAEGGTTERALFISEDQIVALNKGAYYDSDSPSGVADGVQGVSQEVDDGDADDWETIDMMEGSVDSINSETPPSLHQTPAADQ
jgi:hypothetical protein